MTRDNEFYKALKREIDATIKRLKRQGTVGASADCLKQCVTPPPSNLPGAPKGVNAAWLYSLYFNELIEGNPFVY